MSRQPGAAQRADLRLEADAVVVGSGPAGAAAARALAQGGARVIVLEAGPEARPADFVASGFGAMSRLYRGMGATVALGAGLTPLVQGRMVGGSSPINGAICWRLPADVWAGWAADDPALAEAWPWAGLEALTDEVEAAIGVAPTDPAIAGEKNLLMAKGAAALGLAHRPIRRNVVGCRGLGRCMQGCPGGHKRSADLSLLAEAEAAGAVVWAEVEVSRVRLARGRAVGVEARARGGGRVEVRARHAVVLAASAIQTPALLLRSGISAGPVGQGLSGHPGVALAGRFPHAVRAWEGATQGHEVTGLRAEGLKFEALGMDLSLLAARIDGVGADLAQNIAELDRWLEWGAAVRSTARGRVYALGGRAVVRWAPTAADVARYRRGLRVMGEMMLAAGAEELSLGVRGWAPRARTVAELARLEAEGPRAAGAYTAVITHLFGTCRAGSDPARSVVRPDLRHHAVAGLYVADSSVFPSNTGVNPQVPIMALATLCGRSALGG
jgi:choline dehydrogenase-like flavoprotein